MDWLNYHHLLYFWTVAKEGGLLPAGKALGVSHPTISTQIRALEEALGEQLFSRSGRKLALTDTGQLVYRYAEEIFALGRELVDTVKGRSAGPAARLHIGIVDVVPKLIVREMLEPALALAEPVRLVCHEDSHDKLLAELALHQLQLVISDAPVPGGSPIRAHNHLLGESAVSFFAESSLARSYRRGFPRSLDGAPFLLPLESITLRRSLNLWFERNKIVPRVVAEFEDSALFKVFGADGVGIFPAPTAVEQEVIKQYGVELVGRAAEVRERFYAISLERKLTHPAIQAICGAARDQIFSG
ncbi:MAG: transcriptional activator NhaR [Deltaproteobacteria bacterium]|nr:transcriptional activator NhaR [Deltaproteobacteria bacterium]